MSKASAEKRLKAFSKKINDAFVRGLVKHHSTWAVMTSKDLANGAMSGYLKVRDKRGNEGAPLMDLDYFITECETVWFPLLKEYVEGNSKGISLDLGNTTNNQLAVNMVNKEHQTFFQKVKKAQVASANKWLTGAGQAKLGNAWNEWDSNNKQIGARNSALRATGQSGPMESLKSSKEIFKFAGTSETGVMNRGTEKIHTGDTTVGMARMALAKEWLSKDKFYKEFVTQGKWTKLEDKFGEIDLIFKASGIKGLKGNPTANLKLKENMQVSMKLGDTKDNYSGSQMNDWSHIVSQLNPLLTEYANSVEWAKEKGSRTFEEDARNAVRALTLLQLSKGKKVKSKGDTKATKRNPRDVRIPLTGRKKPSSKGSKTPRAKQKAKQGKASKPQFSTLNLLAIVNNKLSATVEKNMGSPRLEHTTGKFANSVRITEVSQTNQGFLSFGYTYAKTPYQVFEVGMGSAPWANPERDPRKLIDGSIREIAANLALGRFYTRRV